MTPFESAQWEICMAVLADMKFNDKPQAIRHLVDDLGFYADAITAPKVRAFYTAVVGVYVRNAPHGTPVRFPDVATALEIDGGDPSLWKRLFDNVEQRAYSFRPSALALMNNFLYREVTKQVREWLQEVEPNDNIRERSGELITLLSNLTIEGSTNPRPGSILDAAWKVGTREPEPTGFDVLDRAWDEGWRPKGLVVIGSPSGTGKTSGACSFTVERARQHRYSLFNSFEQPAEQLLFKMLCNLSNLRLDQVENPEKNIHVEEEWESLRAGKEILDKYVRIYDQQCKIEEIPVRVRRHQAELGPGMDWQVIDHIGIVDSGNKDGGAAGWSRDLERTAYYIKNECCKPQNICSLVYSQVPPEVKRQMRENNRTTIDTLRGSDGVKNATDIFAIGGRHNGKRKVGTSYQYDMEYSNVAIFQTTKNRRSGVESYCLIKYDPVHHRMLNEWLPE